MNTRAYTTILAVHAMLLFGATGALAQAAQKHDAQKPMEHGMSKTDMASMMNQPHAVLAMAYGENIRTFAKSLHKQAEGSSPLNVSFARDAVAEIKRSLDQMNEHHAEHVKTMSEAMRSNMAAMMKDMDMHHSMLNEAVAALEKDVRADQLDAKQIAADSGNVLKHLDEMSKMHDAKKGKQIKK